MIQTRRHRLAGVLILLMVLATIIDGLFPLLPGGVLLLLAGSCAWLAALLLIPDTSTILRWQLGLIMLIALSLLSIGFSHGAAIDLGGIISSNSGLLSMIAAVGFLRLVALPERPQSRILPTGEKAFLQTLLGINITSSVINISAPILIADRIHAQRPLTQFSSQSFTRVFCGVSSWSPFFGAMAVVLTYVDSAQLTWVMAAGFPFTVLGFLLVVAEAHLRYKNKLADFVGYPMHVENLIIPALLMITVLVCVSWLDQIPVLIAIALCALLVTTLTLFKRLGIVGTATQLQHYVLQGLPRMVNELTLFLAAGALAVAVSALIQLDFLSNPLQQFDVSSAILLLGFILVAAALGIHPVIPISTVTPLLLTLDPDPNLLAATYLCGWHLGTCASPLSGTHLVFQGRYHIPSWKGALHNWPYAIVMYLLAVPWLYAISLFLPAID